MKRILLTFYFFFIAFHFSFSENPVQQAPRFNYLSFGAGLNVSAVNDVLNTSLSYTGISIANSFGFIYANNNRQFYLSNLMSSGKIHPYRVKNGYKNPVSSNYENLIITYQWLTYQKPDQKLYIFLGPAFLLKAGLRLNSSEIGNSAITYEAAVSLGLAAKIDKYFSIDPIFIGSNPTNWKLGLSVSNPIISRVFTPSYIGLPENLLQENAIMLDLNSGYNSIITRLANLQTSVSLGLILKNQNSLQLEYIHDYMATYPNVNASKTLNRTLQAKLLFNF